MYAKRVLVFSESEGKFGVDGRQLCGMVKFNRTASGCEVTVYVANAKNVGEWWIVISSASGCVAKKLPTLNNFKFAYAESNLAKVGALLVNRSDKAAVVCSASLGDASVNAYAARNYEQLTLNKTDGDAKDDEALVAATDDFFAAEARSVDVESFKKQSARKYRSVEEYSSAFERYYATGREQNYYESVQSEITRLLLEFPPYFPLTNKYANSYFVRIDFPGSDKYFVMGVLQDGGAVRYICYGVPGPREGFSDKDFVYVEGEPCGFWMLYQDAETGQITTL